MPHQPEEKDKENGMKRMQHEQQEDSRADVKSRQFCRGPCLGDLREISLLPHLSS